MADRVRPLSTSSGAAPAGRRAPLGRWSAVVAAGFPGTAWAAEGEGGATMLLVVVGVILVACAAALAVKRPVGLVLSALAGLGVSGWLYAEHNALKAGAATSCNVASTINCTEAAQSVYSEIAGVPIALLGMAYFAAVAYLAIRHAIEQSPAAPAAILGISSVAVAYDVFLAFVTFTKLDAICPLCVTTWILNVLIAIGAFLALRASGQGFGAALKDSVVKDGANAAIVGLGAMVVVGMVGRGGATKDRAGGVKADGSIDLTDAYEQITGRIELDGTEPVKGDPNAKYVLVEWADFECPHCALMWKDLDTITEENPDLKFMYKHYPISELCNEFVQGERHLNACNAAAASECARKQGKFWELEGEMFKNQEYLGKDDVRFMAKQVGLDMTAFEACMQDPMTAEAVKADVRAGGIAGLSGTPSIFLKGVFGDTWIRVNGGKEVLNAILAAHRKGETLPAPKPPAADDGHGH